MIKNIFLIASVLSFFGAYSSFGWIYASGMCFSFFLHELSNESKFKDLHGSISELQTEITVLRVKAIEDNCPVDKN